MLFCHLVITVCACTFVMCTLIKINQINQSLSPFVQKYKHWKTINTTIQKCRTRTKCKKRKEKNEKTTAKKLLAQYYW